MSYVQQQGISIYGSGVDGTVTVSTTIQLTADMNYDKLTITGAGTIDTQGFMIRSRRYIRNDGLIHANGNAASGVTAGGAYDGSGTIGGGSAGGNGGTVGAGTGGATQQGALGAQGGAGGAGTAGAGGAAGTRTVPGALTGGPQIVEALPYAAMATIIGFNTKLSGGSGGGGGGAGVGNGGGGGGAAGYVWIATPYYFGTGLIQAKGGNGANAVGTTAGGGGGGGGGKCTTLTGNDISSIVTPTLTGGTGGSPTGAGVAGTAGGTGTWTRHTLNIEN